MTDGETNEGDTAGKEVVVDTPEIETDSNKPSPLEEASRINKEKATLLDREEKLLDRKEKIIAAEAVGGRATMGTPPTPEEKEIKEAKARVQRIGEAAGAQWAKPKED